MSCKIRCHNNKDFPCDNCHEWFMIRDDSELNICFTCHLILCDDCMDKHFFKNEPLIELQKK